LDFLITLNITLSIVVLLVAMYALRPLEFSVFPSLLLLLTLYRLSLNVASTRLILLRGEEGIEAAGKVIKTFGSFVVGGNYVVGLIIFFILIIINFVVITKGAGRIAEVAARFTLDAMPGKQMSIDADLNAGLITEEEARRRRQEIAAEADFYGAMDGASKFVRGDAIAGMIIVFVNIIGGLVIGVLQKKMSLGEAARTYTILTVGDGLVSQIPALIVSTAAGIIISRASAESNLGRDLSKQMLLHPKATAVAAAVLFALAFVPGFPKTFFFMLSLLSGAIAYVTTQAQEPPTEEAPAEEGPSEAVEPLLYVDLLELEIGYELIPLVDKEQGGELLDRIRAMRSQFAQELGIIVPPIHIRDNLRLKPSAYSILLKGMEVAKGELMMGYYLAMNPAGVTDEIEGIPTKEPAFGLPAVWIRPSEREKALSLGYTVVDPATVLITHLMEVIRGHAHELLSRQEVQRLLDALGQRYPRVVEELVPNLLPLGTVQKVLQNLLRERIPIKDLLTILETLADYAPYTKDPNILTEYVRQALSRTITHLYQSDGVIPVITLDRRVEEAIAQAVQRTEQGEFFVLDPRFTEKLLDKLRDVVERVSLMGHQPVVMASPSIRRHFRKLIEHLLPMLPVISPNEILPEVKIKTVGVVSLDD
ncbi:MAG TPA: flagellar biosynthesis protein FlhA, partial [Deltaproteobacteria bacterium]|nr:flagellar biosynthesis protein FlhA [Deltaproteobacteria bacterium]